MINNENIKNVFYLKSFQEESGSIKINVVVSCDTPCSANGVIGRFVSFVVATKFIVKNSINCTYF